MTNNVVVDGYFSGLNNLTTLYIGSSRVKRFSKKAFRDLEGLKVLKISNNNITHLDPVAIESLQNLETLVLQEEYQDHQLILGQALVVYGWMT